MPAEVLKAVLDVVHTLKATKGAWKTSKYLSPKLVVRAAQPIYGPVGKKRVLKDSNFSVILTIGRPNREQRAFIKACKKAHEPFPVRKVQIKFPPKPRKKHV